ncbi:MAG: hypothetical protein HN472_11625 [Nitrospina sp.]|nr:hypothetical protein [Nitrospina sp.]MBT4046721.1 hypothetical protein [Nitrospina sp.]MBT4558525.1 hypothetical protein [Nitrospina sp.]MBT7196382.1 hypothetical protein [Nitrospina sp.]MBT7682290.1 hypothetical protein [Nitrospina sp.]
MEVPFTLRYDQKKFSSKMVTRLTACSYLTMTLPYHWPWGGWQTDFRKN